MPRSSNFTGGRAPVRKRAARPAKRTGTAPAAGRLVLAFAAGGLSLAAAAVAWLYFGHPPVAVRDKPALWEHLTTAVPLRRRVEAETKQAPFPASEDSFEAAARIYRGQCAQCHGAPGHESPLGRAMLPRAQQFFGRDSRNTAAKPAGALFWVTNFGVRHSGMPAYANTLSNTDEWNLALLLHSADQDLPDPVKSLLAPTIPPTAPTTR